MASPLSSGYYYRSKIPSLLFLIKIDDQINYTNTKSSSYDIVTGCHKFGIATQGQFFEISKKPLRL